MAVNWYDPNAKKTALPGTRPPSAVPGAGNPNAVKKVGNLTTEQLLDPSLGFGVTFQASANQGRVDALKNAMSTANTADYEGMDQLRDYYKGKLTDLPGQENKNITSFDTQSQRGLANLLTQQKNSAAGMGTLGTRQFAGAQGDIMSRSLSDYMSGLNTQKQNSLQQAGQIQQGMSGVQNQDLQERQFQYNQGKGLSDLLTQMVAQDQGREAQLASQSGGESNFLQDIAPAVGMGAGMLIGGPAGAMIGGSLAGAAVGGSKGASSGGTQGMQLASVLAAQQAKGTPMPTVSTPGANPGYGAAFNTGYRPPTVGGAYGMYGGAY